MPHRFCVPAELVETYLRVLGPFDFTVLMTIASLPPPRTKTCKAPLSLLEELTGISRPRLVSSLRHLIEMGALHVSAESGTASVYTLMPISQWQPIPAQTSKPRLPVNDVNRSTTFTGNQSTTFTGSTSEPVNDVNQLDVGHESHDHARDPDPVHEDHGSPIGNGIEEDHGSGSDLEPTGSLLLLGDPVTKVGATRKRAAPRSARASPPDTPEVWRAYSEAYVRRYGVEPIRNAQVNAVLKQLVQRVGAEVAAPLAAFYVYHNKRWYVEHQHDPRYLLQDCSGLYTQMKAGVHVHSRDAAEIDRTSAQAAVWQRIKDRYRCDDATEEEEADAVAT